MKHKNQKTVIIEKNAIDFNKISHNFKDYWNRKLQIKDCNLKYFYIHAIYKVISIGFQWLIKVFKLSTRLFE